MSLVEQAYRKIKARILDNQYGPRYQALEQDIANDLGMSRTPVREALIRLENEGLVTCIPRRGMRVVPLSADDMREIYQLLTGLETTAVDLLARKHPRPKDISILNDAMDQMERALEENDLPAWARADEQFHKSLLELCGNRRLADMANTVLDQAHRARWVTLTLRPIPWDSNTEHRNTYRAVLEGDWAKARKCHYDHLLRAASILLKILEEDQLREL